MNKTDLDNLRKATVDDAKEIKNLVDTTIKTSYAKHYSSGAIQHFLDFHNEEEIKSRIQCGTVLVVVQEKEIIATGTLLDNKIFCVFVHPDRQNQGYGKAIMAALEDKLIARGNDKIFVDLSLPSVKFYKSLGYCISGETVIKVEDGSPLKCYNAEKVIRA